VKKQLALARYARPQWRGILILLGLTGITIGLGLIGPWPMKILVDYVLGQHKMPHALRGLFLALPGRYTKEWVLAWVAIATIAIFIVNTIVGMFQSYINVAVRQRMTYDLGGDMYRHLQRLSLVYHSRRPVGDTISRVTGDPACVPIMVLDTFLPTLRSVVTLITMFVIMYRLQPHLTLVSLAVVPFLVLPMRMFGGRMKSRTRERRDLEGR